MDTTNYQLATNIAGDSPEDTKLLRAMVDEARSYLSGFAWCPSIRNLCFAVGVGGVIGLFLAELESKIGGTDDFLWVIVGDVPSAYLVTDSKTPHEALETYCHLMDQWAHAVISGTPLEDVFPVAAKPTQDNALGLKKRLALLRKDVLPELL